MKSFSSVLALTIIGAALTSCETTQTSDGPEVVGVAKQEHKGGEWGGIVEFVGGGMTIDDEPEAYQMDPSVDYVDYETAPVRFGRGNTKTFYPPEKKEEVEFKKIGFE